MKTFTNLINVHAQMVTYHQYFRWWHPPHRTQVLRCSPWIRESLPPSCYSPDRSGLFGKYRPRPGKNLSEKKYEEISIRTVTYIIWPNTRTMIIWVLSHHNMNWRDVQGKNVVNNVDMSSLSAPCEMARTKTNTQNRKKTYRTPKTHFLCAFPICISFFYL